MYENCLERKLKLLFHSYGHLVARYPLYFLLTPLVMAGLLGSGLYFIEVEKDVEFLFTPTDGAAKLERSTVQKIFPDDDNHFNLMRMSTLGRYVRVIITSRHERNIWTRDAMRDIVTLDKRIKTYTVQERITFGDICVTWKGKCVDNNQFLTKMKDMQLLNYEKITYPNLIGVLNSNHSSHTNESKQKIFYGHTLGGVATNSEGYLATAASMQLRYYVKSISGNLTRSALWEDAIINTLKTQTFRHIVLSFYKSSTLEEEVDRSGLNIFPRFAITFNVMILFAVFACAMQDVVVSKPWLGFAGVVSSGMAILSAFGLMGFIGVPFIRIVASMPFLIIGIGLDDMFVILSAWRRTNPRWTVEERMSDSFSEAAVAITITSLTDTLAFFIGAATPFPSVQIFCIFTGVAIVFDYIYQITFFASVVALTGKRERYELHCLTFKPAKTKSEGMSKIYKLFCTWTPPAKPRPGNEDSHNQIGKLLGRFVSKTEGKILIVIIYLSYIGGAILGCFYVREGLQQKHLAEDSSYAVSFYENEQRYFKEFGIPVSVTINQHLDYADPMTQTHVFDLEKNFTLKAGLFYHPYHEFWLRDYLAFLKSEGIQNKKDTFYTTLNQSFLSQSRYERYRLDIRFASNDSIQASRMFLQTINAQTATQQRGLMENCRTIAEASNYDVTVYNPMFIFYDQYAAVFPKTAQTVGIAAGCMLVVALMFIPSVSASFWVAMSIASIEIGVVGYMTLWGVDLDTISMVNLIMCIGFCVNFSAHVTFAFYVTQGSSNERIAYTLKALALPITQGAISTLIGICALSTSDAYIFRTFFKIMFLVILLGALHGIFVLPVFLSLFGPKVSEESMDIDRDNIDINLSRNVSVASFTSISELVSGQRLVLTNKRLKIPNYGHRGSI